MWKKFLDTLLPQFCLGCSREGSIICPDCLATIAVSEDLFCPFCSKPKQLFKPGKCSQHQHHSLDGLFSAVPYENHLVKKMIILFKYEPFLKTLAQPLTSFIIAHILLSENKTIMQDKQNSCLLAVPLSKRRQRWRGYNQAALIAQELSGYFSIPLLANNLVKIKKTASQIDLSKEQRQQNIKNAFALKRPADIAGKTIFLIDDVFTTGSTIEECSRVLKAANASQVWALTIAREGLSQ